MMIENPHSLDVSTGGVYLLHFIPPYKHARHYLGYARHIGDRLERHGCGNGARLVKVALDHGSRVVLSRVWVGRSSHFEKRLKARRNAPGLCPICKLKEVS